MEGEGDWECLDVWSADSDSHSTPDSMGNGSVDPIGEAPFEGGSGASIDTGTETPSSHSTETRAPSVSGLSVGSDAADSRCFNNTSGRRTNYESTPDIPLFQYLKLPRPPPAFATDVESDIQDDIQSETLSCD
ncbi:hypothetical protein B0H13DRAFT_2327044 [Mycena leptocephala]|nr:hypothetical protein B0H13DRAFT_2327044 [Mycena leptocephala]